MQGFAFLVAALTGFAGGFMFGGIGGGLLIGALLGGLVMGLWAFVARVALPSLLAALGIVGFVAAVYATWGL